MKLTHIAILALRGSGTETVERLADALNVSNASIYRYLNTNSDDLTKAAALAIIRDVTGLTDDLILEETEAAKA
jgi:predicted DNA-binding transcriptional regulator YafY